MCGRFNVGNTPGLQALMASLGSDVTLPPARYNLAPTENVSLLRVDPASRDLEITEARWWLTPRWAKAVNQKYSMFNARSEGLAKSRAFRQPFASQRGVVAMSSFIEWRGETGKKQPWLITNASQSLAVAALWELWGGGEEPLLSCTLVTTAAAHSFCAWHSRMPVMLMPDECEAWLDNTRLIATDDALFRPELKEPLQLMPLDSAVGNARNKAPDAMLAIGATVDLPATGGS